LREKASVSAGNSRATVGDAGVATVAGSAAFASNLCATRVIMPLKATGPTVVLPEEGVRYLRALPFAFRSPYLHAVFVKE